MTSKMAAPPAHVRSWCFSRISLMSLRNAVLSMAAILLLAYPASAAEFPCLNLEVIDADTVRCSVLLGFHVALISEPVRIEGVNAPEMNTPEGRAAKAALIEKIGGRTMAHIRSRGYGVRDKYGRLLADLIVDGESIAQWLLTNGHAVPYK